MTMDPFFSPIFNETTKKNQGYLWHLRQCRTPCPLCQKPCETMMRTKTRRSAAVCPTCDGRRAVLVRIPREVYARLKLLALNGEDAAAIVQRLVEEADEPVVPTVHKLMDPPG